MKIFPSLDRTHVAMILCLVAPFVACAQQEATPFRNPDLAVDQRAADLVSRMTLEEKVAQMQDNSPAIERLGVASYGWWNEALHGVARAELATVFPQAIGLAATWDTSFMNKVADVISTEARAKYNDYIKRGDHKRYHGLTFWSPNINIFRDPRWGRGQETYGEDPFLTGRMGVAFVKGLQGNDPRYLKVVATPKHFAVHSGPEPLRHGFNVNASDRDLNQTYLPAFKATVTEGKAFSVMCAYNAVDGAPSCASTMLLEDLLRKEWGFEGYVVSDCGAIGDIFRGHKFKPTMAEGSAAAVEAGTDISCGTEYRSLLQAVKNGQIPEAKLDQALKRLFTARIRLGQFDPPERVPFNKIPLSVNASPLHRRLALDAARKSIVLLKNSNQTLPLKPSVRSIAVIGPAADDLDVLLGNYNGAPLKLVSAREGIEQQFKGKAQVRFAQGSSYASNFSELVPRDVFSPGAAGKGATTGLLAEYFSTGDLSGTPKLSRVEPRVYFNYDMNDAAVVSQIKSKGFSIRWSGTFKAPYTGEYLFATTRAQCDGCRDTSSTLVYLDNKPVVTDTAKTGLPNRARTASTTLEAGKEYAIRVEYRQADEGVGMTLLWCPPEQPMLEAAVETVKNADVIVAVLGLNANLEGEEMRVNVPGFQGGDRTSLDLPAPQEKLLRAAVETGKPVIVVLMSGSAVAMNFADEKAAAILEAWYGGESAGTAIAETLAGANNPAGRLPVTFYRGVDQLPPFADYSMDGRTYRYFKGDPLYPFGFGLSYSNFKYSALAVRPAAGGKRQVTATVTNTSKVAGEEVVQLYVSGKGASDAPLRELRGLQRIQLAPGKSQQVSFVLGPDDIGPEPGSGITVSVGGGQPVAKWTSSFVQSALK
jgi:beta-glucosidase